MEHRHITLCSLYPTSGRIRLGQAVYKPVRDISEPSPEVEGMRRRRIQRRPLKSGPCDEMVYTAIKRLQEDDKI